jgi:hypothetical protein
VSAHYRKRNSFVGIGKLIGSLFKRKTNTTNKKKTVQPTLRQLQKNVINDSSTETLQLKEQDQIDLFFTILQRIQIRYTFTRQQ